MQNEPRHVAFQLPDSVALEDLCVARCACQQSASLEWTRATGEPTSPMVTQPVKRQDLSWARSDSPLCWEPQVTVSVPQPWPLKADWLSLKSSCWAHPANPAIAKENVNIDPLGPIGRCLEPLTPRVAIKRSWFATWEPKSVSLAHPLARSLFVFFFFFSFSPSRLPNLDLPEQNSCWTGRAREQIPVVPLLSTLNRPHTEVGKSMGGVCQAEIMFLLTSCCVSQGYPSVPGSRTLEPLFSIKSGTVCWYSYLFTALWHLVFLDTLRWLVKGRQLTHVIVCTLVNRLILLQRNFLVIAAVWEECVNRNNPVNKNKCRTVQGLVRQTTEWGQTVSVGRD